MTTPSKALYWAMRALGDGLEGTILANDSRITDWHTKKRYTDPQHPLGAHVTIRKATL